jgi:competence protein ComGC
MIVLVIIGILVSMAIPAYSRALRNARRGSCVSNQRNLYAAALDYSLSRVIADGPMPVADLVVAGYVTEQLADCPDDEDGSLDDYVVTFLSGVPTDCGCLIEPVDHLWLH